jgi:sterol desaturase/sphingolipid hydroxylase (fatty acid hydroxylase superfamily)
MTTDLASAWGGAWSALSGGHASNALHSALAAAIATKDAAKDFVTAHHADAVWTVARDHVFNRDLWLLAFIPALLLELVAPAEEPSPNRRAELWLDFWYPVFIALFAAPFVAIFVTGIQNFYTENLPFLNTGLLNGKPIWLQALGAFLITDFMFYLCHFIRHKVRWFWYFHAIHHSQEDMNPMTTHRGHFLEGVINTAIRFVPIAFVGGSPISWTIFVVLNGFWGYFIHSNVRTNLGPLKYVIVSPQFHRVHHSKLREHWDKNYGERLILWDWMFGTLHPDFECYPPTGVASMDRWAVETGRGPIGMTFAWFRQSAYPFVAIGRSVRAWVTGKPVDYPAAYLALTGAAGTAMGDHDSPDAAAHV